MKNKINLVQNNDKSKAEQYVVTLDTSLFSNDYGNLLWYLIYVRQSKSTLLFYIDKDKYLIY